MSEQYKSPRNFLPCLSLIKIKKKAVLRKLKAFFNRFFDIAFLRHESMNLCEKHNL